MEVCLKKVIGALSTRSMKDHIKEKTLRYFWVLRTLLSSFKDSTLMTYIHTSNHANKKCTIRDKRKSGMFSSFKDFTIEFEGLYLKFMVPLKVINLRPNTNGPLKNEKFMQRDHSKREIYIQTQTGYSRMINLCQRDHLKWDIYIQTQTGHLRMRNLCQMDHSIEKFTSKQKQATHEWAI